MLANDADADSSLTAVLVNGPSHGTLALNADGSFSYTPAANYNGEDSFTYTANDKQALTNTATVTLTVTAVNDAPVAVSDAYTTDEDKPLSPATGVLGNDTDVDNLLAAVLVGGPAHGVLVLNANGSFTYTPAAKLQRRRRVHLQGLQRDVLHRTRDGHAHSDGGERCADRRPRQRLHRRGHAAQPGRASVLANDTDVDNSPTAVLVAGPSHGTLVLNPDGSFTYAPAANYNGPDAFTYKAYDGTFYTEPATVTLTVTAVNDAPTAGPDSASTAEDTPLSQAAPGVLANDTDVDNSPTAVLVAGPSHGTLSLNPNGSFTYTPAANYYGPDAFTYKAFDGTFYTDPVTVSIMVSSVNDAPTISNIADRTIDANTGTGTVSFTIGDDDLATVVVTGMYQ